METKEKYEKLLSYINNDTKLQNFLIDFIKPTLNARGSESKHQSWSGGYVDHLYQIFELGEKLYRKDLPFNMETFVKVILLHDIEKIIKYSDIEYLYTFPTEMLNCLLLKSNKEEFYINYLSSLGIILSYQEINALKYAHGEGGDYSGKRVANELAGFLHGLDFISSRTLWNTND